MTVNAEGALKAAAAHFERRLAAVGTGDWHRRCCGEWTVREVANHALGALRLYRLLLEGHDGAELVKGPPDDHLGPDPVASLRAAVDDLLAAMCRPGALDATVRHPAGELPARWLTVTSAEELTVHGWDLAAATGGDTSIDDGLAKWLLPPLAEMVPRFRAAGRFREPQTELPADAGPAERLLHLTGR